MANTYKYSDATISIPNALTLKFYQSASGDTIFLRSTVVGLTLTERLIDILTMYRTLGYTILGEWDSVSDAVDFAESMIKCRLQSHADELYQITDEFNRLSYSPLDDTMTSTKETDGSGATMNEIAPTNANIDSIDTPYMKTKGKSNTIAKETVTHSTPDESAQRLKVMQLYGKTLSTIAEDCLACTCAELNTAY